MQVVTAGVTAVLAPGSGGARHRPRHARQGGLQGGDRGEAGWEVMALMPQRDA